MSPEYQVIPEGWRWSVYWARLEDIRVGELGRLTLVHRFWRRKDAEHIREHLQLAWHAGLEEGRRG